MELRRIFTGAGTTLGRIIQQAEEIFLDVPKTEYSEEFTNNIRKVDFLILFTEKLINDTELYLENDLETPDKILPLEEFGIALQNPFIGTNEEWPLLHKDLLKVGKYQIGLAKALKNFKKKETETYVTKLKKMLEIDLKRLKDELTTLENLRLDHDYLKNRVLKAFTNLGKDALEKEYQKSRPEFENYYAQTQEKFQKIDNYYKLHRELLKEFIDIQQDYYKNCEQNLGKLRRKLCCDALRITYYKKSNSSEDGFVSESDVDEIIRKKKILENSRLNGNSKTAGCNTQNQNDKYSTLSGSHVNLLFDKYGNEITATKHVNDSTEIVGRKTLLVNGIMKTEVVYSPNKLESENQNGLYNLENEALTTEPTMVVMENTVESSLSQDIIDNLENEALATEPTIIVLENTVESSLSQDIFDNLENEALTTEPTIVVLENTVESSLPQDIIDDLENETLTTDSTIIVLESKVASTPEIDLELDPEVPLTLNSDVVLSDDVHLQSIFVNEPMFSFMEKDKVSENPHITYLEDPSKPLNVIYEQDTEINGAISMDGEIKVYIDPINVFEAANLHAVIYNANDVALPDTTVIASVTLTEDIKLEEVIENEIDPVNIVVGGTINTEAVIEIEPTNNVLIEDNIKVNLSETSEVVSLGLDVNPTIIIVHDHNITDSVIENSVPDASMEADIGLTGDVTVDLVSSNTTEFIPDETIEKALDLNETVNLITEKEIDLSTNVVLPLSDELAADLENSTVLEEHVENESNNVIIIKDLHLPNPLLEADIGLTGDVTEHLVNSNTIEITSDGTIEEAFHLNESIVTDKEIDLSTIAPLTLEENLTENQENSVVLEDPVLNESINVAIVDGLQLTGPSRDDLQINVDPQNQIEDSVSISMTENIF